MAVKVLNPYLLGDDGARRRFVSEFDTARRVAPFCAARVLDIGVAGTLPFIVTEYVEGPSLQQSVQQSGPRNATALERLAINTATALAAIHQAEVVHLDFKPGNVLLGPDGPVVIDFGISRALDLSVSQDTSRPMGTPGYMAPEMINGGAVGPAADLFAWGATMVYAATGSKAFNGDCGSAVLRATLRSEPDLSQLDVRLRELVQACLAKDPAMRPTAAQVVERLRGTAPPVARRRTWGPVATVTAAVLIAAGLAFTVVTPDSGQVDKDPSLAIDVVMSPMASASATTTKSSKPKATPTVAHEGKLMAAFELKALGAPSYGNNYNNRVEEALGSAFDLHKSAMVDLSPGNRPWLGYFFIMEESPKTASPVKILKGAFPHDKLWDGLSYEKRFEVFCDRLVREQIYDAVCYITSSPSNPEPREPVQASDWRHFSAAVEARIHFLRGLGFP